jgi:hypothetical protein
MNVWPFRALFNGLKMQNFHIDEPRMCECLLLLGISLDLSPVGYIRIGTLMQQDDDVSDVNLKVVGHSF